MEQNYKTVEELQQSFRIGDIEITDSIVIEDILYTLYDMSENNLIETFKDSKNSFVVYESDKNFLVLTWIPNSNLSLQPLSADVIKHSDLIKENQNIIPDKIEIKFNQFNNNAEGRVDTGARMSSIHAESFDLNRGTKTVRFKSSLLSSNTISMKYVDEVIIQTSEGSENRPVIELDITINGINLSGVEFNINDRSKMHDKILVGQNILEKGKFLVDPSQITDEMYNDTMLDILQEMYNDISPVIEDNKQVEMLYDMMYNTNINFKNLMEHMLTVAYDRIDKVKE